jgi:hypothetical protein
MLAAKLGRKFPASRFDSLREQIKTMLEGGMKNKEIAKVLEIRSDMVSYYRCQMRRWGGARPPVCGGGQQPAAMKEMALKASEKLFTVNDSRRPVGAQVLAS